MRIVRVIDSKPCYQLEKQLQNKFMKYSGVKFLSLDGVKNKSGVFYFNKIFTLEQNLSKIKDFEIDIYLDLDTVFNASGRRWIQDILKDGEVPVGNIYYINWEYANILHIKKYLPRDYDDTISHLIETHKRYSTMLIPIKIFEKFLEFLNDINYKKIVEKYYNKYLEEFLYSVFLHKKRLDGGYRIYNLFLRKDNLAENEYNVAYFHLTTKEMLPYYQFYCRYDSRYKANLSQVKTIIQKLKKTKKYKNS